MNYSRRKVNIWYRQWDGELAGLSSRMPALPEVPSMRLLNANDTESIMMLREYFTTAHHWEVSQTSSAETYGWFFNNERNVCKKDRNSL